MIRSSGILLPVFSLPSPYGIGTFGKEAYEFIDFLHDAGQVWWQILPLNATGEGDSPYNCPSAHAGNPLFIDLDMLVEQGLLEKDDLKEINCGSDPEKVDYDIVRKSKEPLLRKAWKKASELYNDNMRAFAEENVSWLLDYARFYALCRHFGKAWTEWPDDIRKREPEALQRYEKLLADDVHFCVFTQYVFFEQWKKLKDYAHEKGVKILGDMPVYVAMNSADVWAEPQFFKLDEENYPVEVSGVPPDYFSKEGQLWGNPLYDYDVMEKDGFGWWIRRVGSARKLYDALRIDHFRGLASYWAVPAGEKTALNGHWVPGPGMKLVGTLRNWFSDMQFIAEDLGAFTPDVLQLLNDSGLPGMKVLEFAFDPDSESTHLPYFYDKNCVCYAGTHDNDTIKGWLASCDARELAKAKNYMNLTEEEVYVKGVIRTGMSSVADLFIAQMQDILELGSEARINTPGVASGNWRWRMKKGAASDERAREMFEMTKLYGR